MINLRYILCLYALLVPSAFGGVFPYFYTSQGSLYVKTALKQEPYEVISRCLRSCWVYRIKRWKAQSTKHRLLVETSRGEKTVNFVHPCDSGYSSDSTLSLASGSSSSEQDISSLFD